MAKDKRNVNDRRSQPTPAISRYTFHGKRKKARREEEDVNYYVDQYEFKYFLLILSILMLCLFDAYLTLNLLQKGGIELNPIMLILIKKDPVLFLLIKITITSLSLLFLLLHKNFHILGKIKIPFIIYVIFVIYFILILYEAYLFITNL